MATRPPCPKWAQLLGLSGLLLTLAMCASQNSQTAGWDNINYASLACGEGNAAAQAKCRSSLDTSLSAIGKGGKR